MHPLAIPSHINPPAQGDCHSERVAPSPTRIAGEVSGREANAFRHGLAGSLTAPRDPVSFGDTSSLLFCPNCRFRRSAMAAWFAARLDHVY